MHKRAKWLPTPEPRNKYASSLLSCITPSPTKITIGRRVDTPQTVVQKTPAATGILPYRIEKGAYMPKPRSGGWGLLLGLYHLALEGLESVNKDTLIEASAPFCHESYSVAPPPAKRSGAPKFYTAWSSIDTLIKHNLVERTAGSNPLYSLSEEGKKIALVIHNADESSLERAKTRTNSPSPLSPLFIAPPDTGMLSPILPEVVDVFDSNFMESTFKFDNVSIERNEIVMILDTAEKLSGKGSKDEYYHKFRSFIHRHKLPARVEYRTLAVGDLAFVIVPKGGPVLDSSILCDFLIERKEFGDLQNSFISGHLQEQESRLLSTGVRRPILLVEAFPTKNAKSFSSLPTDTLKKHLIDLPVWMFETHSSIAVYLTANTEETFAQYLHIWTYLQNKFTNIPIPAFEKQAVRIRGDLASKRNSSSAVIQLKDLDSCTRIGNVTENSEYSQDILFILQVTGMSERKASAIIENVGPIKKLLEMLETGQNELLIRQIASVRVGQKAIGPALASRFVQELTE